MESGSLRVLGVLVLLLSWVLILLKAKVEICEPMWLLSSGPHFIVCFPFVCFLYVRIYRLTNEHTGRIEKQGGENKRK